MEAITKPGGPGHQCDTCTGAVSVGQDVNMSIISIVDKIRSLSIEFDTNQSTNIGNR